MIVIDKKCSFEKHAELKIQFPDSVFACHYIGDKMTFETDDVNLIDYINANFEDYVEPELRLDAIEAQIIGEQSTFSKIIAKVGL